MARFLPALPLIGGGKTRFQPVYVGDVAEAVLRLIEIAATAGRTYELGGPRIYSFRELMELCCRRPAAAACWCRCPSDRERHRMRSRCELPVNARPDPCRRRR